MSLSGTGAALVLAPVLGWTPNVTALDFGAVTVGNSSARQTLTLGNSGTALAHLTAITVSGTAPADFALAPGTCAAGGTLAVGSTCTVVLSYTPIAAGARSATLTLASDGSAPPAVSLSGSATAAPAAALSLTPASVSFAAETGTVAASQTLTLQNSGTAVLQVSQVAMASGGFSVAAAPANGCAAAPFNLAPGASCALSLGWTSASNASESGTLVVTSNAPGATTTATLTGAHTTTAATAPTAATGLSNTGGGGCTLSHGDPGQDPVLPLLVALAALVLWRRRSR